ncbi:MAG: molybdopterin-dependent oxidoreductase, partial [Deltaproteobacteria bacterium]|nr:molybdopterin-dependent oxidoreductase [Deltaproteobacteria bacterium]
PADKSQNDLPALANLLLLMGKVGRIANGFLLLRDHCNSQGLMDIGIGGDGRDGDSKEHAEGGTLISHLQNGGVKACLIFGENPLKDLHLRKYLDSCQLLIVQDVFLTETALASDVFLPASTALETSGSYTNFEGRLQKFSRIFHPKNGMENWQVLCRLAEKLGHPWPYRSPEEILEEISGLADQWPVKDSFPFLHGRARFSAAPPSMAVPQVPSSSFCSLCERLEVFREKRLML